MAKEQVNRKASTIFFIDLQFMLRFIVGKCNDYLWFGAIHHGLVRCRGFLPSVMVPIYVVRLADSKGRADVLLTWG